MVNATPLLTDWLRMALPVLVVAGFIVLAWRFGYFSLKTPAQLDAATDRIAKRQENRENQDSGNQKAPGPFLNRQIALRPTYSKPDTQNPQELPRPDVKRSHLI